MNLTKTNEFLKQSQEYDEDSPIHRTQKEGRERAGNDNIAANQEAFIALKCDRVQSDRMDQELLKIALTPRFRNVNLSLYDSTQRIQLQGRGVNGCNSPPKIRN